MSAALSVSIQPTIDEIQRRWGNGAIFKAGKAAGSRANSSQAAVGIAGWNLMLAPLARYVHHGQIVEISGAAHSGKSSLALALLATLLPANGLAAYIDGTGTFYPPSAAGIGLDLSRLWVARLYEWRAMLALTETLLRSEVIDVVLLDLVGRRELLTSGQLRRLHSAAAAHGATLLVLTTQPANPASQRALDYGANVRLMVRRVEPLWEQLGAQRLLNGYRLQVEVARAPGKPHLQALEVALGAPRRGTIAGCSSSPFRYL